MTETTTLDSIARADLGDAATVVGGPFEAGSDPWLAAWALICRTVMRTEPGPHQRYFPHSCVAATSIGIEAARYFGVPVAPLPVWAGAMTADAYRWHLDHGLGEPSPVGWSVSIGGTASGEVVRHDDGRRYYDGHLVCWLPGRQRLADISIDQAHRPEKGLRVARPLVVELADDYFTEADPDRLAMFSSDVWGGAVVLYRRMYGKAARAWRQGPDWRSGPTKRAAIGDAIRLLRQVTR